MNESCEGTGLESMDQIDGTVSPGSSDQACPTRISDAFKIAVLSCVSGLSGSTLRDAATFSTQERHVVRCIGILGLWIEHHRKYSITGP